MHKAPPNILRFDLIVLAIFSSLYDSFPSPAELDIGAVSRRCVPDGASLDEVFAWTSVGEAAADWLAEEGFIRFERRSGHSRPSGTLFETRLTLKALTILGYLPASLKEAVPREALIHKIKKVLSTGAEKAGADAVKSLMTEVFKLSLGLAAGGVMSFTAC
ncbi:hypothetical protein [Ramlibacter humi]|uniref:Uncharacterized protein n=1 Tax=Ramlibacter humi TaxID=2530451 RepID=A0A4Z0CBW8_9BURK|nr:hypothetical protein [Ramlibacter humi]TFZ07870.1 hypothetical protein EZ216_01520 [Ramlibacter humi]